MTSCSNREWRNRSAAYPLNGLVHEEVAGRDHEWPRKLIFDMDWAPATETERGWKPDWPAERTGLCDVTRHVVYRLPFATIVEQTLEHPKLGAIEPTRAPAA